MQILPFIITFFVGVAFGIMPCAYIIGRLKGIDLKKQGSGNIGATNLGRSFGGAFFMLGFVMDALKGLIPVIIANRLGISPVFAGAGAVIAHIFNPFFGFRGGKGVSTTIGVAVGILPRSFALSLGLWLLIYFSSMTVSLASIGFGLFLPVFSFVLKEGTVRERVFIVLIGLAILIAHRSNIKRLINGSEPKTRIWRRG